MHVSPLGIAQTKYVIQNVHCCDCVVLLLQESSHFPPKLNIY